MRRHNHGIHVFVVEQFAIVVVQLPVGFPLGRRVLAALEEAVRRRDNLPFFRQLVDQQIPAATRADDPDVDAVVGAERATGDEERRHGVLQYLAAIDRWVRCHGKRLLKEVVYLTAPPVDVRR